MPDKTQTRFEKALALHRAGDLPRARAAYESILKSEPRHADALHLLGLIAMQTGRHEYSVDLIRRAITVNPGAAVFHANLGVALKDLGRAAEAVQSLDRALVLKPDYAQALSNRGTALHALGRYEEALASYDRAIALEPRHAEAHANRAVSLHHLGRIDEALAGCERAIAIEPRMAEAYYNRGRIEHDQLRFEAAILSYRQALAWAPEHVGAHWNMATAHLLLGDYEQGWPLYEWRWKNPYTGLRVRKLSRPLWLGESSVQGKTVLLHSEQGFGDTVQFCRYAAVVREQGARVLLEVEKPLIALMSSLDGVDQLLEKGAPLPRFDLHCPLHSLALACATRIDTIPSPSAYLKSDESRRGAWSARLGAPDRPRVGLVWSGSAAHTNDANRSMALADLLAILPKQLSYISLQREVRAADRETLAATPHLRHFGDEINDFADTAALCDLMDVVLSVDTSVAHVSAALGRRTWIMLPFLPDWRWLLNRQDSPWYASVRLYRQRAARDWQPVYTDVAADLENLFQVRGSRDSVRG